MVIFNSSLSSFEARRASSIKAERPAIERVRENCAEIERLAFRPVYGSYDITNLAKLRYRQLGYSLIDMARGTLPTALTDISPAESPARMKAPRPDNAHRASRLGTKFKLVKIVILSLTNVQNIHVTLAGARTPNVP
ncbi:hypothetical protein GGE16_001207 [Rhizobium leguminosarum]|uniref:Uncharacterized protein n=1 Tax=Rhizobium leguminosarum TaxID=384 RepID=A0AAE2MH05_RHILE|nr:MULTISPECIES: DUF2177 family protein [Rhizobium]MBB4289191.1 hypothetical protein [Rhizobium leguminosarum]MBB4294715.1 hypothetical protein [Rhizobium leguminosarum]MBB4306109.1 hypothetical protein [Rhizobium leguminosarum]MBB4418312.1 hypothetical protein [Rhizobium leguminosarum]MBB4433157.1 hypothetical protein [Rhizobium esperanzae]